MKWKFRDKSQWHDKYLWFPHWVSGYWRWRVVVRARYVDVGHLDYIYEWQYCLPGEEW